VEKLMMKNDLNFVVIAMEDLMETVFVLNNWLMLVTKDK
jgi:hypothetical protein